MALGVVGCKPMGLAHGASWRSSPGRRLPAPSLSCGFFGITIWTMRFAGPRVALILIVLLYVVLGCLYAIYTPPWQAPDEPAHYNYVRYVAENGSFPVLHLGDYPHAYLEQIKAAQFPPGMPIDGIRYEFHQPPLYYVIAAGAYTAGRGALLPVRLLSVLLGVGIVLVAFVLTGRIFPARPGLALAAAAFVAFLPQHLASVAQVGNDTLAELLFGLVLLEMVTWVLEAGCAPTAVAGTDFGAAASAPPGAGVANPANPLRRLAIGLLLGLILITKTTAYIAVPLAAGVALWNGWRRRSGLLHIALDLLLLLLPALLIALPWYLRDVDVYGWPDFLGLRMHDAVVIGQVRTADFVATQGWAAYLERLITYTFKSFWGVFGWLGAFMDARVYDALAMLCLSVAGGLLLHEGQARRRAALAPPQRYALRLLALSALATLLAYGWYNLQFLQHQGRYLFTALIPVAIAFGLGWNEVLQRRTWFVLAGLLVLAAAGMAVWGLGRGELPRWPIALALAGAFCLALRPLAPRSLDPLLFAVPYALLPALSVYALFGTILPQLAR